MVIQHDLITLAPPTQPLRRELLEVPGAFLWWYVDLLNEAGDGLVAIWSYGLPFLPGIASAARRGAPRPPGERPSLNVVIYRAGEPVCYLLQEYAPEDVSWESGRWRFGQSVITQTVEDHQVHLNLTLDCAIAGTADRLRRVEREPHRAAHRAEHVVEREAAVEARGAHDWSPLMGPASGVVDLRAGQAHYKFEGRAYHDRNSGEAPLHALGFEDWIWGRLAFEGEEILYYILWPRGGGEPEALGVRIDASGRTSLRRGLDVRLSSPAWSPMGMRWHERVELFDEGALWLDARVKRTLDMGPFYQRFQLEATRQGARAVGIGEACLPDRIDLAAHRPLVQMRIGRPRHSSIWLPLFCGPHQGRVTRLLSQFLPGGAR